MDRVDVRLEIGRMNGGIPSVVFHGRPGVSWRCDRRWDGYHPITKLTLHECTSHFSLPHLGFSQVRHSFLFFLLLHFDSSFLLFSALLEVSFDEVGVHPDFAFVQSWPTF